MNTCPNAAHMMMGAAASSTALQGCEGEGEFPMWWILLIFLGAYGAATIMSNVWYMIQKTTFVIAKLAGEHEVQVKHIPAKNNPADKQSKEQQTPKKIAKKKVEKFLQGLTVDILQDILRKKGSPTSGLKADIVQRVLADIEETKID